MTDLRWEPASGSARWPSATRGEAMRSVSRHCALASPRNSSKRCRWSVLEPRRPTNVKQNVSSVVYKHDEKIPINFSCSPNGSMVSPYQLKLLAHYSRQKKNGLENTLK